MSSIDKSEYREQLSKRRDRQTKAQQQTMKKNQKEKQNKYSSLKKDDNNDNSDHDNDSDNDSDNENNTNKKNTKNKSRRGQSSSDHNSPLLKSKHFNYDSSPAEEPSKRKIEIKRGEFQWNSEDKEKLHERLHSSKLFHFYSWLRPSKGKLTRSHLFGTNEIKSTKYSLLSFLPVNLFEQLAPWIKPANFYFLCIAVLQAFPSISTTQGRPSILLPLMIVVVISAIKDGLEDYGRAKQDYAKNNAEFKTLRSGHYQKIASKDLLVGDIVMIEDGQRVPADCVLLSSGISGGSIAYVDTKNLDGETNLKPKSVPQAMLKSFRSNWKKIKDLDCFVTVDAPNGDMRAFAGELKVSASSKRPTSTKGKSNPDTNKNKDKDSASGDKSSEPLTLEHFILSDCLVRNTPWLIGLIVYSGEETKIRENMKSQLSDSRRKESRIFQMTKRIFLLMVGVQCLMCLVAAILAGYYQSVPSWYLHPDEPVWLYAILRFLTWFIIVKDFIPISLYVSLELVQFLQALFMQWDDQMRHTVDGEMLSTRVNSSSLNEELAQVHYIFSDKTGTLTENSMVFKKCVIGEENYGKGETEAGAIRAAKEAGKNVKAAIREFQNKKSEEKEQDEKDEKEGKQKSDKEKHVEFDEMDEIRALLGKSEANIGQIKGNLKEKIEEKQNENEKEEEKNNDKNGEKKEEETSQRKSSDANHDDDEDKNKGEKQEKSSTKKDEEKDSKSKDKNSTKDKTEKKPNSPKKGRSPTDKNEKNSDKNKNNKKGDKKDEGHHKDDEEQAQLVREFMYCLSLNNSVFPKVKDEEEAGKEGDDDKESGSDDDDERGIIEVVVNPVVSAFNTVGESAKGAVESIASLAGGSSDEKSDGGGEHKNIEDGEVPEAEKKPDEAEKEGYDDPNSNIVINLEASSPDETALTSFAALVGFELYARNEGIVRLRVRDFDEKNSEKKSDKAETKTKSPKAEKSNKSNSSKENSNSKSESADGKVDFSRHFEDFEEVYLIDYNSKRKRMTIILRPYDKDGKPMDCVKIYSKGADTAIAALLNDDDPYWTESINPALADYGGESLRTLVCAYSEKEANFFDQFKDKMDSALKSQGKEEKGHVDGECSSKCGLCAVENEIEEAADLKALGCTGIEDKLQDGVPHALQTLLDAGMKVWMLTGDTVSTAVNIAMACNLIDSDMENDGRLFVFDKDIHDTKELKKQIDEALKKIEEMKNDNENENENEEEDESPLFGLALHGDVWKMLQKERKKKNKSQSNDSNDSSEEAEKGKNSAPDLFRQPSVKKSENSKNKNKSKDQNEKSEDDEKSVNFDENVKEIGNEKENQSKTKKSDEDHSENENNENSDDDNDDSAIDIDDEDEEENSSKSPSNKKNDNKKSAPRPQLRRSDTELSKADLNLSSDAPLMDRFFALCSQCQSVIACRLEPKEKADIVDEMREREGRTCLAIGDGNNDTLMIKRADIGVGIAGVEGTSAVSSSDFALAQFRFLPRLLLVHGRYNHRRISIMINYIFYKTAFVVWALFFYGIYSQFSGQVFILDWAFQFHNVAYTALPILVFAIFDRDFTQETLESHAQIYPLTRFKARHMDFLRAFFAKHSSNLFFSYWDFFEWIMISILHGCLCFFICLYALNEPVSSEPNGQEFGVFDQGAVIYTAIIFSTNLMLVFFFSSWTWLHHVSLWGSLALYCAAMAIFSSSTIFDIAGGSLFYTFYRLAAAPSFYLMVIVSVGACMMTTMMWQHGKKLFDVKEEQIWREAEQLNKLPKPEGEGEDEEEKEKSKPSDLKRQKSLSRTKSQASPRHGAGGEGEEEPRQHYTGSVFSYTPGIRSLRRVVPMAS